MTYVEPMDSMREVLGLSSDATVEDIWAAVRELKVDRDSIRDKASREFAQVAVALGMDMAKDTDDIVSQIKVMRREMKEFGDQIVAIARNKCLEITELLTALGFSMTEREAEDVECWRYMLTETVKKVRSLTVLTADSLGADRELPLSDVLGIAVAHAKHDIEARKHAVSEWADLMAEADKVAKVKGRDYTKGSPDRTSNFKVAGSDAGISPLQAWLVFYNKHHAAVCSYVRSGGQNESEPIFGRFVDLLNYIRLGWLLVKESEKSK